jgi:hypothetical protein
MGFADEVSVCHCPTHQQPDVSRQKNPVLASREIGQHVIPSVAMIGRIESGQAQTPRQRSEMDICEEADMLERLRSNARVGRDIKTDETRENGDSITASNVLIEADGHTVDEDQINFRVGNSRPFNNVLDRRMPVKNVSPRSLPAMHREEIIEWAVRAQGDFTHVVRSERLSSF